MLAQPSRDETYFYYRNNTFSYETIGVSNTIRDNIKKL